MALVACQDQISALSSRQGSILREAQENGYLNVVTVNASVTYYEGRDGLAGFEYDLVRAYGEHLGVEVKFQVVPTIEAVLQAAKTGQIGLAASGLSVTAGRREHFVFGPKYRTAVPVLVCRRGVRVISELSDLAGLQFHLAAGTSFVDLLQALRATNDAIPAPKIVASSVEALLADVAAKRIDCTIADDHVFALNRRYLPTLEARMELGEGVPVAWILGGGHSWRNASLSRDLEHWMAQPETTVLLAQLEARYFAVADTEFDYVDLSRLRRAMRQVLPKLRDDFEAAAKRYDLPWSLLAAIAWRESHWKADAVSRTGVRGMMMLTRLTAREQGVTNRLDAAQSIRGGARYFASLIRRLPDTIEPDQRYAFALAAYNMGWGHMIDARQLVAARGGDPDLWANIAAILPELQIKAVYKTLPHGYARGREGEAYVQAVLNFADIIEKVHAQPILPEPDLAADGTLAR